MIICLKIKFYQYLTQFKGLNKNFNNQIIKNKYKFSDYILSPSDFGFHNIIIKDKKCYFIDFEYSGLMIHRN